MLVNLFLFKTVTNQSCLAQASFSEQGHIAPIEDMLAKECRFRFPVAKILFRDKRCENERIALRKSCQDWKIQVPMFYRIISLTSPARPEGTSGVV